MIAFILLFYPSASSFVQLIRHFRSTVIVRYWLIVFCVLTYLEQQRVRRIAVQEAGQPPPTWGDIRAELQREHRRKLLLWLCDQLLAGADVVDLQVRLAA